MVKDATLSRIQVAMIWTVLYPAQVIPCGIHGRGDGLQKFHGMGDGFHTFGGWIPWNGGWIPYFFQMDSIPFPDGFHTISIWNPGGISSWNHNSSLIPSSPNLARGGLRYW